MPPCALCLRFPLLQPSHPCPCILPQTPKQEFFEFASLYRGVFAALLAVCSFDEVVRDLPGPVLASSYYGPVGYGRTSL